MNINNLTNETSLGYDNGIKIKPDLISDVTDIRNGLGANVTHVNITECSDIEYMSDTDDDSAETCNINIVCPSYRT